MLDRNEEVWPALDYSDDRVDKALASLAIAPLREDGWPAALKDMALAAGRCVKIALLLSDLDSGHVERMMLSKEGPAEAYSFTGSVRPKSVGWQAVHSYHPQPAALRADSAASHLVRSLFSASEILAGFEATRSFVSRLDMSGVQGLFVMEMADHHPDQIQHVCDLMRRVQRPLEQASIAHSAVGAIKSQLLLNGSLLDHLPFGLIKLDRDGRVAGTNAPAKRLLDRNAVLTMRDQRLHATDSSENEVLQASISRLLSRCQAEASCIHKFYGLDDERPWSLSISSVETGDGGRFLAWSGQHPALVVCLSDRAPITSLRARQVATTFGLSPQEEMLAARIAAGDSLARIAKTTRRSIETLRTQLRAVFQKTEARSQAELVQLVLCAPAGPGLSVRDAAQ